MRKIVTTCICPPTPDRSHDWCAHFEGEEERSGYGYGATRNEAIADFMANCVENDVVSPAESLRLLDAMDPDVEAMITRPAATVAGSVNLLATMSMLSRPAVALAIALANTHPIDLAARAVVEGVSQGDAV